MERVKTIETWERLIRFHRAATRQMDTRLRTEFGYSLDDYDVLHQVRTHNGPIRMGELTTRLLVAHSSGTRIVGRLVDDGLLARTPGTDDRREVLIELTQAGKRLLRRMTITHTRDIDRLVAAPLADNQLAHLDTAIRAMLDAADC